MLTDRETVVGALRARGEHDAAIRAACLLPKQVDTREDAGVLHQLGLDVSGLEHEVSGSRQQG